MARTGAPALAARIRSRGRRLTSQRVVVAEALARQRRAVSAQELYRELRERHLRLGLATVYRALEAQVESGMATRLERPGHEHAYVACDPEHHHHLVCVRCERVEDLSEDVLGSMLRAVQSRHAFLVDHARLDLYGLCGKCRRAAKAV
ncbi:MAG: transcriptional repressor [Chloroflexota bacterium]|nr:transcriptional repressor [Chloroflexota bacterium]